MKVVAISDTHGRHKKIKMPEGDVLLVAGDITPRGEIADLSSFARWCGKLDFKHKLVIAGNHDFCFQGSIHGISKEVMKENGITYMQDEEVVIEGIKFYGSPWQPWFHDWAFNLNRGDQISKMWQRIPRDADVLITHGPPYKVLDFTHYDQEHVGCYDLGARIDEVRPILSVFGHIHEGYGVVVEKGITFANVSIVNLDYEVANKPFVATIEPASKTVIF